MLAFLYHPEGSLWLFQVFSYGFFLHVQVPRLSPDMSVTFSLLPEVESDPEEDPVNNNLGGTNAGNFQRL